MNRRLQKLACEALLLPTQMSVRNVELPLGPPIAGGAFADLFLGNTVDGSRVGVKYLRGFKAMRSSVSAGAKKVELVLRM